MTFTGIDYTDFLKLFTNYQFYPSDTSGINPGGKVVYLRHDIDGKPDHSLKMAEIEHKAGIKSTYFALNFASYWENPETFKILRQIQAMGHEVGWHQCVLEQMHRNPALNIMELITEPLKKLREEGLSIRGTSPHGGTYGNNNNINSWQLWTCFNRRFLNYQMFNLSDFGLEYEAMRCYRSEYLCDSGNTWNKSPEEVAKAFSTRNEMILQLTIHPQWWF